MGTSAGGGGLARSLPSHLWERRGRILGKAVLYVCGNRRVWSILANQASVARPRPFGRQAKGKGHEYSDQESERQIVSRVKRYGRHCGKASPAESGDGTGRGFAKDGRGAGPCGFIYGGRKQELTVWIC